MIRRQDKKGYWKSITGKYIPIERMGTAHLLKCIEGLKISIIIRSEFLKDINSVRTIQNLRYNQIRSKIKIKELILGLFNRGKYYYWNRKDIRAENH